MEKILKIKILCKIGWGKLLKEQSIVAYAGTNRNFKSIFRHNLRYGFIRLRIDIGDLRFKNLTKTYDKVLRWSPIDIDKNKRFKFSSVNQEKKNTSPYYETIMKTDVKTVKQYEMNRL